MKLFNYSRKLVYDTNTGEILTFKEFEEFEKYMEKHGQDGQSDE